LREENEPKLLHGPFPLPPSPTNSAVIFSFMLPCVLPPLPYLFIQEFLRFPFLSDKRGEHLVLFSSPSFLFEPSSGPFSALSLLPFHYSSRFFIFLFLIVDDFSSPLNAGAFCWPSPLQSSLFFFKKLALRPNLRYSITKTGCAGPPPWPRPGLPPVRTFPSSQEPSSVFFPSFQTSEPASPPTLFS